MSSAPFPTSTRAFYGLNFLRDVQTTKLNAQLDVKGRFPLNIYVDGRTPDFSCALFRPSVRSGTERRAECGMIPRRAVIHAAVRDEHLSNGVLIIYLRNLDLSLRHTDT